MMEYHGRRLRLRLEGESHSPEMRVTIWGLPVGEPVDKETLLGLLARRRPGQSPLTTGRNEKDEPEFLSGARDGMLTGEPVVIRFANEDRRPEDYAAIRTIPRPGHADYPQYLQGGAIPSGGGALGGRMTLLLCGGRLGREWRRTVRTFAFIWISTALLGGTGAGLMYLLGARGYGPLAALGTAALGGGALIALTAARNRKMSSRTALLTVQRAGRRVSLVAIVDTGNALVEPLSNLPVIVVEKDALSGVAGGRMRAVPFTSVGGGGVLSAFAPDSVRVDGREVEAFVAVYDGVLNTEGRALIPGRCMG